MSSPPGVALRRRILFLFFSTLLAVLVLVMRLAWIQVALGEELRARAEEDRTRSMPVQARRGTIFDRRGRELAISVNVDSVFAVPAEIEDAEATAAKLASTLGMDYGKVLDRLTRRAAFVWIKRQIDPEVAAELQAADLPGIGFTQESRRYYPKGSLASHVLGIAGIDNQGLEGVEVVYDEELRGTPGKIIIEYDARGRELPQAVHRYVPPVDGQSLVLTIDEVIQFITERELEKAVIEHQALRGVAIVMDPRTGEILAMANRPDYDPNHYQDYPVENRRNLAVTDALPPGSTFKPLTVAMAVEEGVASWGDTFHCPGNIVITGVSVSCWKSHGTLDLEGALEQSCNVAMANLALRLGAESFFRYAEAFNLTNRLGIDFPGEGKGSVPTPAQMRPLDLGVMGFGQTLTMTPLQLLSAIAALANDGVLMKPYLVKQLLGPEGEVLQTFSPTPLRQVVSEKTAREVLQAMVAVVEEGTGRNARVEGYTVAGKTGTAQKVVAGGYERGRYLSSFVGIAPASDPRIAVLVMIDEPKGTYYGGQVAAPAVAAIIRDTMRYLDVPPDASTAEERASEEPLVKVPLVINLSVEDATMELRRQGLGVDVRGGGGVVVDQVPPAGAAVVRGTKVVLSTSVRSASPSDNAMVTVPELIGKSMREVAAVLGALGLRLEVVGSGIAVNQYPEAGERVPPATTIRVEFQPPADR